MRPNFAENGKAHRLSACAEHIYFLGDHKNEQTKTSQTNQLRWGNVAAMRTANCELNRQTVHKFCCQSIAIYDQVTDAELADGNKCYRFYLSINANIRDEYSRLNDEYTVCACVFLFMFIK